MRSVESESIKGKFQGKVESLNNPCGAFSVKVVVVVVFWTCNFMNNNNIVYSKILILYYQIN